VVGETAEARGSLYPPRLRRSSCRARYRPSTYRVRVERWRIIQAAARARHAIAQRADGSVLSGVTPASIASAAQSRMVISIIRLTMSRRIVGGVR